MPLDAKHLQSYSIPEVRQQLTRADTAFYALSVGLGMDPMDRRQLDFVDPDHNFMALPSMAVVMAHPGFWLGNPDTGVDATRVVHGEQEINWHGPLPVEGEVLGRTRVTGLVDKGNNALMYSEKQLLDTSGTLLATCCMTTVLRGAGGFGESTTEANPVHELPKSAPERVVDFSTRPEQALYYRLNGDFNPLHSDPDTASQAGYSRPILHGLCTLGVVFHALFRELADYRSERLQAMRLRFSSPVYPGETIRTEMWYDGSFRARVVERDVVVVNNGKLDLTDELGAQQ
ncbi:MaoC family protein [Vreelandella aquamarina]|jgi:acyl dehydratase|uniref:MaoC family protein n=1 Tax=Vreelandella aquamarina TaxID=77097 RepID=A0A6F8XEH9_9GAMM|nr:MaoC/PaaZ C-terminal domain-containing protein [Halomonas meridiana]BCB72592.1 MaoC family protein [Halomonas meridiana]